MNGTRGSINTRTNFGSIIQVQVVLYPMQDLALPVANSSTSNGSSSSKVTM